MRNILLLSLTSLLTDVSSEMIYPLLPLFLTATLGATPAAVGLIEGIAESLASLLKAFSGYASDRIGRRKPLAIGGYAFSALSKACFVLATSWGWVLVGRVLDRFGKGIRTAPRDALLADAAPAGLRGRVFGLHRAFDTAGAFLGVALAYLLLQRHGVDYTRVFLWSLVPAAIGVAVLAAVREAPGARRWGRPLSAGAAGGAPAAGAAGAAGADLLAGWRRLDPRLRAFLWVTLLFTLGNSSNQFLLLRAGSLGFAPDGILLLYLVFNGAYALASYPAGRLSDRFGRRALLVAGYAVFGAVYLAFALAPRGAWLWGLFAAYGLYTGITEGVSRALVADLAPAAQRATLLGLHAAVVGIGLLPASLLAGIIWNAFGAAAPFYLGGALGLAAALAMARVLAAPGAGPGRSGA